MTASKTSEPLLAERPTLSALYVLSQLGTAAKGVIYLGTALVAALSALNLRRAAEDPRGVLNGLFHQPLGTGLVAVVAATLAGFSAWRIAVAVAGRNTAGQRLGGWMRIFLVISAGIHAGLAWSAWRLFAFREELSNGDGPTRAALRHVMTFPCGQLIVFAIGATVFGIGIGKLVRSYRARIWRDLSFRGAARRFQSTVVWMGRVGEATRGVIYLVCGGYMMQASVRYDPSSAHGFAGALDALQRLPFGTGLLLLAAGGLFCYGAFLVMSARFQKI